MSQEVRDAVAMLEGWTKSAEWPTAWDKGDYTEHWHPIADDLTACAKAWDEQARSKGWTWQRRDQDWFAFNGGSETEYAYTKNSGTDAASELRDRWELLGLVLKARGVV